MIRPARSALVWTVMCVVAVTVVVALVRARAPTPATVRHPHTPPSIDDSLARDDAGCARVRSTVWHPLSGLEYTGRLTIDLPARPGGAIVLFVGDSIPLDLEAQTLGERPVHFDRERLPPGPGVHLPPDFWLEDGAPWSAPREITRVTIDALDRHNLPLTLSLGRRAPRVIARLAGYPPDVQAPVCAHPVGAAEIYFATGWYGEETGPQGRIRWMREHGAVLLSSTTGHATQVRLRAAPAAPPGDENETFLRLRVNDVLDAPPVAMRAGFADYDWNVPDSAWVAGTNELFFSVSRTLARDTRTLGMALASVTAR